MEVNKAHAPISMLTRCELAFVEYLIKIQKAIIKTESECCDLALRIKYHARIYRASRI